LPPAGIDWTEVAAITGIVAVLEAPLIALAGAAWRWARSVDRRLGVIEARSHLRREGD
jgi:hypothetical protein